ncbi:MAG: Prolyl-tRNA editing protein ProX [Planctomycetota bacterium]|jgi:prolyl-tRNA editing enzyme YbaK/EbsC (Cys-tRNA(Pro) deacylase)
MNVLESIRQLLIAGGAEFRELEHEPTPTSEDSARVRGEPLSVGAKALLLKIDDTFGLFVLPADRKLDSAAIKASLGAKKSRFATPDELLALTGLVPGCVPPFGHPILPFELWADTAVGASHGRVAFNAGSLTHSIIMSSSDWERLANPRRLSFSKT